MALSEHEQAALRGYWLGEALEEDLRRLIEDPPRSEADGLQQLEMRRYLLELTPQAVRRTRRMGLAFAPVAVAQLVELIRGENMETSRKAAVDLLRHWDRWACSELAADAVALAAEHRRLTAGLTDDQVAQLWAILAEGHPSALADGDPLETGGLDPLPTANHLAAAGDDPPAGRSPTAGEGPAEADLVAAEESTDDPCEGEDHDRFDDE